MISYADFITEIKTLGLESQLLFYSNYPAIVRDNNDPKKLGRVKVQVPLITNKEVINSWIPCKTPNAVDNAGFFAPPSLNSDVLVSFRNGNPRYPIYEAGYFGEKTKPPSEATGDDYPNVQIWKSPSGHYILYNDAQKELEIKDASGNRLFMKNGQILVKDKDGNYVNLAGTKIEVVNQAGSSIKLDGGEINASNPIGAYIKLNALGIVETNGLIEQAVLGNSLLLELIKGFARQEAFYATFLAWVPILPPDIALKAQIVAILAALPPPLFSPALLSNKVKLG
jgi:phage baseplate assembly protein gpV